MVKKGLNILMGRKMLKKIRPLCIFLPKITAYRKDFDESKYISFLIKDDGLLEKYNEIWEKVKNSLKAKIKSCNEKLNRNFHNNKIPKECSLFICLSVILIDSVFKTGKNYYPQVF